MMAVKNESLGGVADEVQNLLKQVISNLE